MNMKTHSFGKFDFVSKIGIFGGLSLVFVMISIIYLFSHGITYGIDFVGGTELQVKFKEKVTIDEVRKFAQAQQLNNPHLQGFGDDQEYILRFQTAAGATDKETNENQNKTVEKLKGAFGTHFSTQGPEIRRVDSVGPQVGAELKRNGYLAVFYSLLMILIYIALRFDYKYSPGAVICLFHDAVITLAIFVFVGKEVNVPILAAILTLIGYSLNDTIVVFDRIRETEGKYGHLGIGFVVNKAINDMLMRTIITSSTVFVSAICLYFFAGGTVSDIAFALSVGIVFGTYSSIYVAAPFVIILDKMKVAIEDRV